MNLNEAGIALIKRFEGLRLTAYQDCIGLWTIGYGHTRTARRGMVITDIQAIQLLMEDLAIVMPRVRDLIQRTLSNNQYSALVSFAFNVGITNLENSTLLKLIHEEKIYEAADQFLLWQYAGGKIEPGLTARRIAERDLFLQDISS